MNEIKLKIWISTSILVLMNCILFAQNNNNPIDSLIVNHKDDLKPVIEYPEKFKLQIAYTQINRDNNNIPTFKTFTYHVNNIDYFYPASSIKIFAAALALEKLNDLNIDDLDKYSNMMIDSSYSGQTSVYFDSTAVNFKPSIAHYIRKLFVVSDNDAFNRLYEFLGQEAFNESLKTKGFNDTRIVHRLSLPLSEEENRHTNGFTFYLNDKNSPIYTQEPKFSNQSYTSPIPIPLGKGYQKSDRIINDPMDFSTKNYSSLMDLHKAIKVLLFPESFSESERFHLTEGDYDFIYQYMSQYPKETTYPNYNHLPDNYCKFLMFGSDNEVTIDKNIRIYNKIGNAYGFSIDNAYIVDFKNNIEFILTVALYTNENQILNDGIYEYDEIAFPFMENIGQIFYQFELKRKVKAIPDLSRFRLKYDR